MGVVCHVRKRHMTLGRQQAQHVLLQSLAISQELYAILPELELLDLPRRSLGKVIDPEDVLGH